jgi:RimJ/RimL family protein N-acetyltransferase
MDNIRQTFIWIQNQELRTIFSMRGYPPDWETHVNYFNNKLKDQAQKVFAIYYLEQEEERHIGNCGLKNIDGDEAEFWIYIGEVGYKGKGLGTKASKEIFNVAFNEMNLKKLYLYVSDFNIVASQMYKSFGFKPIEFDEKSKVLWADRANIIKLELLSDYYKNSCIGGGGGGGNIKIENIVLFTSSYKLVQEIYLIFSNIKTVYCEVKHFNYEIFNFCNLHNIPICFIREKKIFLLSSMMPFLILWGFLWDLVLFSRKNI